MFDLVLIITPIALLDSTSIIPLCIVLLVILLSGPAPLGRSGAFLTGIFVTYLICGLLILFGLQSVFDAVNDYALEVWKNPNREELIFQLVVGLVLLFFGFRKMRGRKRESSETPTAPETDGMTAIQAFLSGAGLTIVGMPGAVPYLAAIDLVLRSDVTRNQEITALVLYNIAFVVPLAAIVALRLALGERGQEPLDRVRGFFERWGRRIVIALMLALGAILVADAIGWFLGTPLIPV
ncbi:MAG: GAP family protein [Pseudomonadota bacterium]